MRERFRLPFDLNMSPFDLSITTSSSNGALRIRRRVTLRVLAIAVGGILGLIFLVAKTPIGHGGLIGLPLTVVGYLWLLVQLCAPTQTKQVGLQRIHPMLRYLSRANREVSTRSSAVAAPVEDLIGFEGISKEEGLIQFTNKEIGYVYEIVGNASILMFDDDRNHVLKGARNFFRKVKPQVSLTFDTLTSAQRVEAQLLSKIKQHNAMHIQDENLTNVLYKNADVLRNYVGERFKSLHQYMMVRAKNRSILHEFESWLSVQTAANSDYLKSFRRLDPDEAFVYLHEMYTA